VYNLLRERAEILAGRIAALELYQKKQCV